MKGLGIVLGHEVGKLPSYLILPLGASHRQKFLSMEINKGGV